jgi:hypothetical protein
VQHSTPTLIFAPALAFATVANVRPYACRHWLIGGNFGLTNHEVGASSLATRPHDPMCLIQQVPSNRFSSSASDEDLNSASKDDAQNERFGEGDHYLTINHYHGAIRSRRVSALSIAMSIAAVFYELRNS